MTNVHSVESSWQPDRFVAIDAPQVRRVPIVDLGEPLRATSVRRIEVPGHLASVHLRTTVADRLEEAAEHLHKKLLRLGIVEGFRPQQVQRRLYEDYRGMLRAEHPHASDDVISAETALFAAPPDQFAPHATGGAVDVVLTDENGNLVDMGCRYDATPLESDDRCYTLHPDVHEEVRDRRMALIEAMTTVGFVNYPSEWWHWSYGDQYWAHHVGAPEALYGCAE